MGIDVCLNGEVQHYRDEGCAVHPSCLHCPAPRCLEEGPRDKQRARTANRAAGMAALRDQGVPPREIARRFHVSLRTVQRGLNLMKRMAPPPPPSPIEGEGEGMGVTPDARRAAPFARSSISSPLVGEEYKVRG